MSYSDKIRVYGTAVFEGYGGNKKVKQVDRSVNLLNNARQEWMKLRAVIGTVEGINVVSIVPRRSENQSRRLI